MQIHEITRKPLNEFVGMRRTNVAKPTTSAAPATTSGPATAAPTSGSAPAIASPKTSGSVGSAIANSLPGKVVTGTAAVAGGIGSALGKSLMSKAFGGVDVMGKGGTSQSREDFMKSMVNSPEAKTLATTMQASWAQTIQNFLAHSKDANGNPAASLSTVTQPSVESLRQELHQMVNQMVSGRNGGDYTTIGNYAKDPAVKRGTQSIVTKITQMIDDIYKATVQGVDPKTIAMDWMKLVGDGILPAQNSLAYDRNSGFGSSSGAVGPAGFDLRYTGKPAPNDLIINFGRGWEPYNETNPQHKAAGDAAGIKRP
jgi:hypothetical protein